MQDVCKVGDVIKVKVTKVDDKGKVNVSRKALLPKQYGEKGCVAILLPCVLQRKR